eukprot:GHRR01003228.1.p1 GENE.GHRR01003228.1~~GHRR01003228.1.p1  ORF type:complete len:663 (+),score=201.56 GHRR01003228.1:278-2266(+)
MGDKGVIETCRRLVRERVLKEMLGTVVDSVGGGWKVLVMDALTTRIVSSALRMSDILDTGVSVVEDLDKAREPLPLAAVYYITPSPASVQRLLADFADKPLYPSVHVFFSNRVTPDAVEKIKRSKVLLPLLKTLKEVNLEFVVVDGRTFVTEHPHAMIRCMGERSEGARQEFEGELDSIASRLVTALATLHDYPAIRYKAGKPPEPGDAPGANARSLLTQKLAQKVSERAMVLQRAGGLPARESCELLILDRSVDPVAPIIHEWTYEAMVYDLLPVEDNIIRYTAETASGKTELKEHVLDESNDGIWAELRHSHIADVYTQLSRKFQEFQDKNKAAKYQTGKASAGAGISNTNIKALIQALPQFREVLGRLSVHIFISSELKNAINSRSLTDLGELEQNLVYGEKNSQDLMQYLKDNGNSLDASDKMRLLMAYLATHPEKLDAAKRQEWQQKARLDGQDMAAMCNLAFLNVAVMNKQSTQSKGLSFGFKPKKKKATYRKREGRGEEQYTLSRFDPMLLDVVEDAIGNKLSQEEYPYVRAPEETDDFSSNEAVRIASARTNRSTISWARKGSAGPDAGSGGSMIGSGMLGSVTGALQGLGLSSTSQGQGKRLIVFVIGGVTRSEMRAVHEVAKKTGKDVLLGSTVIIKPSGFLSQLRSMGSSA